jgi:hypothetical protein
MGGNETDDAIGADPRGQEGERGFMTWRKTVTRGGRRRTRKSGSSSAHATHDCAGVVHGRRVVHAAHVHAPAPRHLDENLALAVPVEVEPVVGVVVCGDQSQADSLRARIERQPGRQRLASGLRSAAAGATRDEERERRECGWRSTARWRPEYRSSRRSVPAHRCWPCGGVALGYGDAALRGRQ